MMCSSVNRPGWTSSASKQYSQRKSARRRTWSRSRLVIRAWASLGFFQGLPGFRVENGEQVANPAVVGKFFAFLSDEDALLIPLGEFFHAVLVGVREGDLKHFPGHDLGQVAISSVEEAGKNSSFARAGWRRVRVRVILVKHG